MRDVLAGFATIWIVIGVGWVLAQLKALDEAAQGLLSKVAFFAGMPCLLFVAMSKADLRRIFSANVIVSILAIVIAMVAYLAVGAGVLKRPPSHLIIGTFSACYVNANNMGLPICAYVLHDTSWVAPVLLIQVVFLQPLGLSLLDAQHARDEGRRMSWLKNISLPFRNPMTIATLTGLLVNLLGVRVPAPIEDPIALIGGLAVPAMLIAFGISLRFGALPGQGNALETGYICAIKLLVQPLAALLLAVWVFHLDPTTTLAVTVMAGLPSAQNIFVFSMRYQTSVMLARDAIFLTTVASIPTVTGLAALVHVLV